MYSTFYCIHRKDGLSVHVQNDLLKYIIKSPLTQMNILRFVLVIADKVNKIYGSTSSPSSLAAAGASAPERD